MSSAALSEYYFLRIIFCQLFNFARDSSMHWFCCFATTLAISLHKNYFPICTGEKLITHSIMHLTKKIIPLAYC